MALFSLLLAACTKEDPDSIDISDNPRTIIELSSTTRSFVEGGNDFAFKLTEQVANQEKGNFMISPLSVNLTFGMILEAAEDGPAMDEICQVLGYENGSRKDIRNYCKTMIELLPEMDKLTKLSIANMVLTNSSFGKTNSSFEKSIINNYRAQVINKPFNPANAIVKEVNSWAKQSTNGLIPEALSNKDISSDISSIFLNALYFRSEWMDKFIKSMTGKEPFILESGEKKKVQMMKKSIENAPYFYSEMAGRLSLAYGNGAFRMDIYLPDEGVSVNELIGKIASGDQKFTPAKVDADVWLPKFNIDNKNIDLIESLNSIGIQKAFQEKWLKLFEERKDVLTKFFQSSKIIVDENGTEAASVTVVETGATAAPPGKNIDFHCDRPFLFTISETSTEAILFAGVFRGE